MLFADVTLAGPRFGACLAILRESVVAHSTARTPKREKHQARAAREQGWQTGSEPSFAIGEWARHAESTGARRRVLVSTCDVLGTTTDHPCCSGGRVDEHVSLLWLGDRGPARSASRATDLRIRH